MLLLGIARVIEVLVGVAAQHLAFVAANRTFHYGLGACDYSRHGLGFRHNVSLPYIPPRKTEVSKLIERLRTKAVEYKQNREAFTPYKCYTGFSS